MDKQQVDRCRLCCSTCLLRALSSAKLSSGWAVLQTNLELSTTRTLKKSYKVLEESVTLRAVSRL